MMNTKNIPIFFSFDNNYVTPAAVAFYSLLKKSKENIFYEMFVLHSDIVDSSKKLLQNIINTAGNASLTFIDTQRFLAEEWSAGNFEGHNTRAQFTADTLIRCFPTNYIPTVDKIIYSDVDVVFMDDISEIIDIDLEDKYIAGVKNPVMKFYPNELNHLSTENYELLKDSYLAGGIWVMNLKKIREDNLEKRMLEIVKDDTIIKKWNDQDIINIACQGKVTFLPLNYISYPYIQDLVKVENFTSHYSNDEIFDSIFNPKILHYAAFKPWNTTTRYDDIWWAIFEHLKLPTVKSNCTPETKPSRHHLHYRIWEKLKNLLRKKETC